MYKKVKAFMLRDKILDNVEVIEKIDNYYIVQYHGNEYWATFDKKNKRYVVDNKYGLYRR